MFDTGDRAPNESRNFVHKRLIGAATGLLTGGPIAGVAGFFQGGGGREPLGSNRGDGFAPRTGGGAGCGPFRERNPVTGQCGAPFVGTQPGADFRGGAIRTDAVAGGFNMPAFVPEVVGNISRTDGSTGPILRCPRGTVLATDNLCYAKGTKGLAAHRKWKKGPPPFLTGADRKCLLRANTLRSSKTSKRILKELGMG